MDVHLLASNPNAAPFNPQSSKMPQVDNRIEGRLALITGASGGIGAACARDLYSQGAHLALTYSKNKESVAQLVDSLLRDSLESGQRLSIHQVDLESVESIEALFAAIKVEHDGLPVDILVSNAGYGKRIVDIEDIPLEEFEHTLNVNLRASFLLVKGVVAGMKAQHWGRIVFVSSIAAYGGGINGCHYAASKGGLQSLMRNLSTHLAAHNISVNDVSPAMVGATGMIPSADSLPGLTDKIPLKRLCEPGEVANVVRMFVTTGFCTGQSLVISGGLK